MTDLAAMLAKLRKVHADSLTISLFNPKTKTLEDLPLRTPCVLLPSPVLAAFLDIVEAAHEIWTWDESPDPKADLHYEDAKFNLFNALSRLAAAEVWP